MKLEKTEKGFNVIRFAKTQVVNQTFHEIQWNEIQFPWN